MATSVLNILNKAAAERGEAPAQVVDFAKVEQAVAANRPKPSARDIELAEARELAQLESAYNSLFEANGESWESVAKRRRERVQELSEAVKQVKDQYGSHPPRDIERKLEKAETELSGLVRKLANAEALAAANVQARFEFEQDGRLARLKALRQAKAARKRNPLEVL